MLKRTLEAILRQEDVDLEVIVVNEACEDDTVEMVASLGDARVSMVHHDAPRGLPAARNSGLTKATAHWVAFCDDDDTWAPTKLVAQLEALDASPEAKWCACGAVHVDSSFRVLAGYQPPPPGDVSRLVLQDNFIPGGGSGTMALTSLVRDLGAFDTRLKWGEDWDMWSRLSLNAPMAGVNRPLVAYLIHDQSMSRNSPRFNRDVAIIEEKYADERGERGISLDRARLELGQADIDLDAHRRRSAAWHFLGNAYRGRSPKSVVRAGLAILSPRALSQRRKAQRRPMPDGWLDEANAWLEPLRAQQSHEQSTGTR
jgi:glycosyltransferase involved in cell wall biosynthesis